MAHACAFFNNKGGVGKTTSISNLGDRLANAGYTVAVVDLDPQCNLTQYFLSDAEWEELFLDSASSADNTIWKFVRPISQSQSLNAESADHIPIRNGRFGFHLVPGHPFMSRLDDALAEQWANYRLSRVGGIEATLWCHLLVEQLERQIDGLDFVLFDLGPSLGPLNRSTLLACDSFLAPVSPDLFSLYSFDNLKSWFSSLQRSIIGAQMYFAEEVEDHSQAWWYERFSAGLTVDFIGYISQQYVTRTTKGERRKTRAYSRFLDEIPEKAYSLAGQLGVDTTVRSPESLQIGIMPHMYSMVSLAHEAHAPIADLSSSDGLNGAQFRQRDRYVQDMDEICREWVIRMGEGK